jgi:methylaspartate mutase sigma subunit
MKSTERIKGTLITGVIGEDVHIIGIRLLEHSLREADFKIVSLGIHTSQEDFINAARETKADAILVSSLAGHARVTASGLKDNAYRLG